MYSMNQPVNTPKGIGHVTGKTVDGKLAVELWKSEHEENWKEICPTGGPSKLFFFREDEITEVVKVTIGKLSTKRPDILPTEVLFGESKKKRGRPRKNV